MHTHKARRKAKARSQIVESWRGQSANYKKQIKSNVVIKMGWGNLLFANTFSNQMDFINELKKEKPKHRNLGFYPIDPHVTVSFAPNDVFIDPSHTFRVYFESYKSAKKTNRRLFIRRLTSREDIHAVNRILMARNMVSLDDDYVLKKKDDKEILHFVAESTKTGEIVGFVNGVDHYEAFNDPERGTSLWSLAVDPNSSLPGVGEALTRYLIEYFMTRQRSFLDLSVIHENEAAINLYEKLGFRRIPVFCVKLRNSINESLYIDPKNKKTLNPYGQIIINEAMRRGVRVKILDKDKAYFELSYGGRHVVCRESLTDLTSAIAVSRCSDKELTSRMLKNNKVKVPAQMVFDGDLKKANKFLAKMGTVVVKPIEGEQGRGVKVSISTQKELKCALDELGEDHNGILIEQMVEGDDIRIIVIDYKFVAAAVRRPPTIVGDGRMTVRSLIQKLNKRRMAATGGESRVPFDAETERTLKTQKLTLDSVLDEGRLIEVRKTANLHTGGTISDITDEIPEWLKKTAVKAAKTLEIPVTGLDFIVPKLESKKYWVIEANERPGLANHEPQPTAERFIDFLFPLTRKEITPK